MQIKMSAVRALLLFTVMSCLFCDRTNSSSVQLASNNLEDILTSNELVFVNFYADWCRFSQMLKPIFNEAAEKVAKEFPEPGKIVFGRVDCDRETGIAAQYHVSKYPTLKLFRHGTLIKREYRGQRSAEAFTGYIRDQLRVPVQLVERLENLDNLERKKRNVVGYFDSEESHEYLNFKSVANMLREDCLFHAAIGEISEKERISGNKIIFKPPGADKPDVLYTGPLGDYNHALQWATDKCVPLVREITFENAEELTEEGLPFMILFHSPTDTETPENYRKIVAKELMQEKSSINFLSADGLKFTHPLFHLGKSANDLPLLAIDSFRHMYLWKNNPKTDLETPGLLKQFVADLHSGKLHREFHHGPDTTKPAAIPAGGDDAGAIATVAPGNQDPNVIEFDVQQQLIMHSDGVQVQVVRFVQLGRQQPVDLREHLARLGHEVGLNDTEAIPPQDGAGQDQDVPEMAIEDRILMAAVDPVDGGGDQEKEIGADHVPNAHIPRDRAAEQRQEAEEGGQLPLAGGGGGGGGEAGRVVQGKIDLAREGGEGGEGQAAHPWEQHRLEKHHREHHRAAEVTTRTVVRVTQVQMKLVDEEEAERRQPNTPPESMFAKLAPSRSRYTVLRDEL